MPGQIKRNVPQHSLTCFERPVATTVRRGAKEFGATEWASFENLFTLDARKSA
jgi:hypothetical protein